MVQRLSDRLEAARRSNSGAPALLDVDGRAISFDQLCAAVRSAAAELAGAGVQPGALVALEVRHPTVRHILRFSLLRLGTDLIETGARQARQDYGMDLDWCVTDDPALADLGHGRDLVFRDSWLGRPGDSPPASDRGGRMITATSGTTGTPKLRIISEAGFLARLDRSQEWRGVPDGPAYIGYRPGASPGIKRSLGVLLAGHTLLMPQKSLRETLLAMDRAGCTKAELPPFNFNQLLDAALAEGLRPRGLTRLVTGGGGLAPGRAHLAEDHFGCPVYGSYGSNETNSIAFSRLVADQDVPGCVGRPHDDLLIRIAPMAADEAEDGSIQVKVPPEVQGRSYPGLEPLCAPDGWTDTGDIGRLLPDGRLVLTGRRSELINIGGNKRAPSVFEAAARTARGVQDVAAFAVPDGRGGDRVGLAVVGSEGFDLPGFAAAMADRFGPRVPFQIALVHQIPGNAGGKVDRKALSHAFAEAAREAGQD